MSGGRRHTVEYIHHGIAYDDWARRLVEEFEHACGERRIDARAYGIKIELKNQGALASVTSNGHPLFPSVKFNVVHAREDGSSLFARDARVLDTLIALERRQRGIDERGLGRPPAWSFWGDEMAAGLMSSYDMTEEHLDDLLSPSAEVRIWESAEDGTKVWFDRGPTRLSVIEMRVPGVTMYGSGSGRSWLEIEGVMPETVCMAAIGRGLADVIGHKAFSAMRDIRVTHALVQGEKTIMEFERRDQVELQPVPEGVRPYDTLLVGRINRRDETS